MCVHDRDGPAGPPKEVAATRSQTRSAPKGDAVRWNGRVALPPRRSVSLLAYAEAGGVPFVGFAWHFAAQAKRAS